MSLHLLASGALLNDPQRTQGAKGPFTTAAIRANGEEPTVVSVIAFGDEAEQLLGFTKGDALAVSGRARLTTWTGRDGTERHGLSLLAEQIASAKSRHKPAAATPRRIRRSTRAAGPPLAEDRIDDLWREPVQ